MQKLLYTLLLLGVGTLGGQVKIQNKTGGVLVAYYSGGQIMIENDTTYPLNQSGNYNFQAPANTVSIDTKAYQPGTVITFTYDKKWKKLLHKP